MDNEELIEFRQSRPKLRKKRKSFGMIPKIVFAAGCVIVTSASGAMAYKQIEEPITLIRNQNAEIAAAKEKIQQDEIENDELQRKINYLSTPEGTMTQARGIGYLKSGEVAIIITPNPHPPAPHVDSPTFGDYILRAFERISGHHAN